MKRHNARIIAVLALYSIDINDISVEDGMQCYENIKNLETEYEFSVEIDYDYSEKVVKGVLENLSKVDELISNSLIKYTIDRLSYVDRAIIRLATYEMLYEKLAKGIAIDEALQITREYSNLDDSSQVKFNNSVLDNIAKRIYE